MTFSCSMALTFRPPESLWPYVFQCFCAAAVLRARSALKSLINTKRTCDFSLLTYDFNAWVGHVNKWQIFSRWPRTIKTMRFQCRSWFSLHLRSAFRRASECHNCSDFIGISSVWAISLMCIRGTCRGGLGSFWRMCFEIQKILISKRTFLADLYFSSHNIHTSSQEDHANHKGIHVFLRIHKSAWVQ